MKKKNLLKHFGNIQKIRNASLDDLKKVKSLTSKDAKDIYNHFHSNDYH
jgi:excinuclease ABC subunit C